MSKKSSKTKKSREAFATLDTNTADTGGVGNPPSVISNGRRWYLIGVFCVIAIGGTYLAQAVNNRTTDVPRYTYEVIKKYPHDAGAFTQGLVLEDGVVWESTGKLGQSSIRKVDLATGEVLKVKMLPDDEFGEGLALADEKFFQLTWKNEVCHVYDRQLKKIKDFEYEGQGWGLTYDGKHLVMSDGTSRLRFIDPNTFEVVRSIFVKLGRKPINDLNELEYTGGSIYANRLNWDNLYEIDPKTGDVVAIIELHNLWNNRPNEGVLNGIAVDREQIIVTGKYCPNIFEIKLKRIGK